MSAHSLSLTLDRAQRAGFFKVPDPGSGGTISYHSKGKAICALTTAGAENRALPAASAFGVGAELLVYGKALVGAATITGAGNGSVVLAADGDAAQFVVVDDGGVNEWQCIGSSESATIAADLDLSTAPVALGTVTINTGDGGSDDAIVALFGALKAFGLVSGTWTAQA